MHYALRVLAHTYGGVVLADAFLQACSAPSPVRTEPRTDTFKKVVFFVVKIFHKKMRYVGYLGWFGDPEMIGNVKKMIRKNFEIFDFRYFSSTIIYFHLKSPEII